MHKVIIPIALVVAVSACTASNASVPVEGKEAYCLQEVERDNLDYMTVVDPNVCENATDDVEIYMGDVKQYQVGDVVYIEADSDHSKTKIKQKSDVTSPKITTSVTSPKTTVPTYSPASIPTTTKSTVTNSTNSIVKTTVAPVQTTQVKTTPPKVPTKRR
jgi:hypothetical protein